MSKKANQKNINKELAQALHKLAQLLEMEPGKSSNSKLFRIRAYKKAALTIEGLKQDVADIYKNKGKKGLLELKGIGQGLADKIAQYIDKGAIKELKELKQKTAIQQVITHYFKSKGLSLGELKTNAKKRKIVYSRYTRPAKHLIELAGSVKKAKQAITTVAEWAKSRNLDYAIETVFKKWLELDRLKPKEVVKKPYYEGDPMVWSQTKKKWYVISPTGEWLEFAGKKQDIEWREQK